MGIGLARAVGVAGIVIPAVPVIPARACARGTGVAAVKLVFLGLELVLELLETVRFRLVAVAEFQVAQEFGVVIGCCGMAVCLRSGATSTRPADDEPKCGSHDGKDNHNDDPRGLGDAPDQVLFSPDHVHQAIDEYGKNGNGDQYTGHTFSLASGGLLQRSPGSMACWQVRLPRTAKLGLWLL